MYVIIYIENAVQETHTVCVNKVSLVYGEVGLLYQASNKQHLYFSIFHVHFLPAPSFCPQHYSFPLHLP